MQKMILKLGLCGALLSPTPALAQSSIPTSASFKIAQAAVEASMPSKEQIAEQIQRSQNKRVWLLMKFVRPIEFRLRKNKPIQARKNGRYDIQGTMTYLAYKNKKVYRVETPLKVTMFANADGSFDYSKGKVRKRNSNFGKKKLIPTPDPATLKLIEKMGKDFYTPQAVVVKLFSED